MSDFTVVYSINLPFGRSKAGSDLDLIQISLFSVYKCGLVGIRITQSWFTWEKHWGPYQNNVTSSLISTQRWGHTTVKWIIDQLPRKRLDLALVSQHSPKWALLKLLSVICPYSKCLLLMWPIVRHLSMVCPRMREVGNPRGILGLHKESNSHPREYFFQTPMGQLWLPKSPTRWSFRPKTNSSWSKPLTGAQLLCYDSDQVLALWLLRMLFQRISVSDNITFSAKLKMLI